MLKKALAILKDERCDIACLNANPEKQAYKLYEKLGFRFMQRPISFESGKGKLKHDTGTMLVPICSRSIYDFVMNSTETFHYGKGYW